MKVFTKVQVPTLEEVWKEVKGFEGIYEVSSLGRVKSLGRVIVTHAGVERRIAEKLLNTPVNGEGYQQVSLSLEGTMYKKMVHQLVAEAFLSHTPNGMKVVVDHLNSVKTDNRVHNLNLTTQRDNLSRIGGTSKYVGVSWNTKDKKWRSVITIDGKTYYLGGFTDEVDAARAYQEVLADIEGYLELRANLKMAI